MSGCVLNVPTLTYCFLSECVTGYSREDESENEQQEACDIPDTAAEEDQNCADNRYDICRAPAVRSRTRLRGNIQLRIRLENNM